MQIDLGLACPRSRPYSVCRALIARGAASNAGSGAARVQLAGDTICGPVSLGGLRVPPLSSPAHLYEMALLLSTWSVIPVLTGV